MGGGYIKQFNNDNRTTALERTVAKATWGLRCILLVPNLRHRFSTLVQWLMLQSILRRWFCCWWFIVYCCSRCLYGFGVWPLFCHAVLSGHSRFVTILMGNRELGGESRHLDWVERAGCFTYCLPNVLWLLVFCDSSMRCFGLVCNLWLYYFLVIPIYSFVLVETLGTDFMQY